MLTFDFDRLDVGPGDRLLDLGCGNGRHTYEALRRGAHVVSVDLDPEPIANVGAMVGALELEGGLPPEARWVGAVGNALSLPFAEAAFDRVIVSEVFEHIMQDEAAMQETARVLAPGGRAAVSVPRFWPEVICWALSEEYRTKPGGHVRIYRFSQLVGRLRDAGLRLQGGGHAHALHAPYWWLKCLFGVEDERALVPRKYHDFLVWEMTNGNRATRVFERVLDPVLGKSLVLYLDRGDVRAHA
jgi:SAM-dependent methyltransferase